MNVYETFTEQSILSSNLDGEQQKDDLITGLTVKVNREPEKKPKKTLKEKKEQIEKLRGQREIWDEKKKKIVKVQRMRAKFIKCDSESEQKEQEQRKKKQK